MKVVLDTNVLITAFKDDYSYQKQIIDEIARGRIEAFANSQTMAVSLISWFETGFNTPFDICTTPVVFSQLTNCSLPPV